MLVNAKAHFYKHFVKLYRNAGEIEWMLIYPLVHLFSIGFLVTFVQQLGVDSTAITFMLVGTFAWNFYVLLQRGITAGLLYEIWSESSKHWIISPSRASSFIVGNGAYGLFSGLISLVVMHIVAVSIFSFNILQAGPVLVLGLAGLALYGMAEGLIVNAIMILRGPEYMHLTWIITGIIMVLSAVYYPLELLPPQVQIISNLLPTTHAIQAIRTSILQPGTGIESGIASIGIGIIYLVISAYIFTKAIDKSRENGIVLRL